MQATRKMAAELCDNCCIFFFFQAEDGIRDADVTGVQTCALPICYVYSLYLQPLPGCPLSNTHSGKSDRGFPDRTSERPAPQQPFVLLKQHQFSYAYCLVDPPCTPS